MGNSFGKLFNITTYGESHGGAVGVVINGCPPGIKLSMEKIQVWLDRRRPGQSHLSSPRNELDQVQCFSGLEEDITLGTPLSLYVMNKNVRKDHYKDMKNIFRPSHADYTTETKYGIRPSSGGGRASARETIGRVAAAAVAEQVLEQICPSLEVLAWVDSVKDISVSDQFSFEQLKKSDVEADLLRCPDKTVQEQMKSLVVAAKKKGDSVGGTIRCLVRGCPVGLGEPVFDKLEADLAKAMMSLPATKGFEIGLGFSACQLFGSEHNDAFANDAAGKIVTKTNRSGGIQGGISNGENILMRIAFKPVATIFKSQDTVTSDGKEVKFSPAAGRHDPCVLPRAVPMVEAMALLVLTDHFLRQLMCASTKNILSPNNKE